MREDGLTGSCKAIRPRIGFIVGFLSSDLGKNVTLLYSTQAWYFMVQMRVTNRRQEMTRATNRGQNN